jgi:ubiquinone/menaquinone biosynthesis C-methylase UbiE
MKPCKSRRAPTQIAVLLLICVDATEFIGWCAALSGMNSDEYANLDRMEQSHWYYAGKRELVRRWIERVKPLKRESVLLDCGAGTGRFALEMSAKCRVMVLDDHEESLALLRQRFPAERVLSLPADGRVLLPDGQLDCLTALDVLEHIADDAAAVRGFHRLLRPGGVVVVTVPACMSLWSDWDEALHHFRRYERKGLAALFPAEEWETVHLNYTNALVFPAVWFLRRCRRRFPSAGVSQRAEDRVPAGWLNRVLKTVFVCQAMCRMQAPFGVSLVLVALRR